MIKDEDHEEFMIWFNNGVDRGWISTMFCDTHEGPPLNDEEMKEFEDGGDPCVFCIKVNQD
jgi:hypothetical protein